MKKVLALTVALMGLTTAAQADQGFYVQGDLGYAKFEAKDEGVKAKENLFNQRVGFGYDFGQFRTEINYTHFEKMKENQSEEGVNISAEVRPSSIGLTGIYEFDQRSALKPYVGVKLSQTIVKSKAKLDGFNQHFESKATESKTGYGVLVGVNYNLTNNLALNANIEYDHLGKFDTVKLNQYGVKTGLKYTF